MKRQVFLAAYDIASPRRLPKALKLMREYSIGGQKSVFECPLTRQEKEALLERMTRILDAKEDRFFLLRLDPRSKIKVLGGASIWVDERWYYVG